MQFVTVFYCWMTQSSHHLRRIRLGRSIQIIECASIVVQTVHLDIFN
jgi:hypothetical protein